MIVFIALKLANIANIEILCNCIHLHKIREKKVPPLTLHMVPKIVPKLKFRKPNMRKSTFECWKMTKIQYIEETVMVRLREANIVTILRTQYFLL